MTPAGPHLLYVITDLELGGVPLHLYRLARAMRERSFRVSAASLRDEGPVGRMLRDEGFEVYACAGRSGWDARVLGRLRRIISAARPSLMHTFLFHANVAGRWAARRAGLPAERVICEIQTVEVERRWHLLVDGWTYRGCRFTIGNSPSVVEHLATRARIPRERLRLVRGGIDPEAIRAAEPADRASLGLKSSDRVIAWAGRLDPVKGLTFLLDAFVETARDFDAHLVLAGGGPMRDAVEAQVDRLGLAGRVHLLGPRRDVPSLLKVADVFVFPSLTEGLPNALLEAMAAGLPIVATDVPGNRDLIRTEVTGLLVPYGDTASLTAAIGRLLADPPLAARLGGAAAQEVTRHWHQRAMVDGYAALYAEAIGSAAPT